MTTRSRRAPQMSETVFQHEVIKEAKAHGWLVAHVEKAQRRPGKWTTPTTAGLPDLILVKPPRVVFLELKRQTGSTTSAEQIEWISALQNCFEVEAFFARPSDAVEVVALLSP